MNRTAWPRVDVVVTSGSAGATLRRTVQSVLDQDYPADVCVLVVHDGRRRSTDAEHRFAPRLGAGARYRRSVQVEANRRSVGLAGSRNQGLLCATAPVVALCAAGDVWRPSTLRDRVAVLRDDPSAAFVLTGSRVHCAARTDADDSHWHDRVVSRRVLDLTAVLGPALFRLQASTLVLRTDALGCLRGLFREDADLAPVTDLDFLARAAAWAPLRNVPKIGVDSWRVAPVAGGCTSVAGALERFSQLHCAERRGGPALAGRLALAHAGEGHRRPALRWAGRALRVDPVEPAALLAFGVLAGAAVRPATGLTLCRS